MWPSEEIEVMKTLFICGKVRIICSIPVKSIIFTLIKKLTAIYSEEILKYYAFINKRRLL